MDCDASGSDCAAGDHHDHRPKAAAIQAVVHAFTTANVTNPDGAAGVTLHVDVSNAIAHQNALIIPNAGFSGPTNTGFDAVKNAPANFGGRHGHRHQHLRGCEPRVRYTGQPPPADSDTN